MAVASAVERGMQSLAHRGPDDQDVVQILSVEQEGVVFGHRRLAVIDLSEAGHQPMRDPETGNWIVYNGEVYNFRELRRELEAHGRRFRSDCDTEVILQSYGLWGRACVERWRGMFAAAIWDAARQELFLARDRLGIKPLYYSNAEGQLLFASELRALLALGFTERKIDLAALDTYLMFGAVQDPLTLIEGVMSLPAAHTLTVNRDGTQLQEYWDLPLEADDEPLRIATASESVAERLMEAVRLRLISDVPLGVFLSGGVDSSAIAMLMRRSSPEQVKAFTVGFVDKTFDEAERAKRTARQWGIEHHTILLDETDMLASCAESVAALDQPSIDGVNTFHVARAVKQAGITVALSGLGGDEIFCGYKQFRTVPQMERFVNGWSSLPYSVRRAVAAGASVTRKNDRSLKLRALLLNDYGFAHPYFLSRALFLPNQIAALLEPEAISVIEYGQWGARLRQMTERAEKFDAVNRVSYLELKTYIANMLLRDADAMSMAHALEVRVPFLDHMLVEEVMRLPGRIKLDSKMPKPLLVRSLPESLPSEIINSPKQGFTLPFANWLRGGLRAEVEGCFEGGSSVLDGIISSEGVRRVWRSFLAGECGWTRPWSIYILLQTAERLLKPDSDAGVSKDVYASVTSSSLMRSDAERKLVHS